MTIIELLKIYGYDSCKELSTKEQKHISKLLSILGIPVEEDTLGKGLGCEVGNKFFVSWISALKERLFKYLMNSDKTTLQELKHIILPKELPNVSEATLLEYLTSAGDEILDLIPKNVQNSNEKLIEIDEEFFKDSAKIDKVFGEMDFVNANDIYHLLYLIHRMTEVAEIVSGSGRRDEILELIPKLPMNRNYFTPDNDSTSKMNQSQVISSLFLISHQKLTKTIQKRMHRLYNPTVKMKIKIVF